MSLITPGFQGAHPGHWAPQLLQAGLRPGTAQCRRGHRPLLLPAMQGCPTSPVMYMLIPHEPYGQPVPSPRAALGTSRDVPSRSRSVPWPDLALRGHTRHPGPHGTASPRDRQPRAHLPSRQKRAETGAGGWSCPSIAALSPARPLRLSGGTGQNPGSDPRSPTLLRGAASPSRGAASHPEEPHPHPGEPQVAAPGAASLSQAQAQGPHRGEQHPRAGGWRSHPGDPPRRPPRGRTHKRLRTERGRCWAGHRRSAPRGPRPCAKRRAAGR